MGQAVDFIEELTDAELLFLIKYASKDPFEVLLLRYYPLVGKATQGFFIRGYDKDDFWQEARMVFYHAVYSYDETKGFTFGKFFQLALRNHIYSLVRKDMAQKRTMEKTATSLEGLTEKGICPYGGKESSQEPTPLEYAMVNDQLSDYSNSLSHLEKKVFGAYLKHETIEGMAEQFGTTINQIKNALDRCKRKMKKQLDEPHT